MLCKLVNRHLAVSDTTRITRQCPCDGLTYPSSTNSLVLAERRGRGQRYRMLETIRQYAEEKLFVLRCPAASDSLHDPTPSRSTCGE
jgi:predicted ATPase